MKTKFPWTFFPCPQLQGLMHFRYSILNRNTEVFGRTRVHCKKMELKQLFSECLFLLNI